MRKLLAAVALGALLAACTAERRAHIECACPADAPKRFQVGLQAPTGEWQFNPHAMGFYETHRSFEVHLPEHPGANFTYSSTVLALVETTGGGTRPQPLSGGNISLDGSRNILSVNLEVQGSAFWANGSYPATWFLLRPREL